jgi:diacylglycerol O-acyltransferase / wax synthase
VANNDRLTGLDASFLHLERDGAHMHVASVLIFEGQPPSIRELTDHLVGRLDLVPRYRQRLAPVPLGQGRPVWVDDPHFNPGYHVRHTALPAPYDDEMLKRLAGRLFSQRLDRTKPLWEIWLVDGLSDDRFALIAKTHHALVDGVSGVDITTVLFDTCPDPAGTGNARRWVARPLPSGAQLLAEALVERATAPRELVRGTRALVRTPRQIAGRAREALGGVGALAWAGVNPAPPSLFNVPIGPHRRYTWVDADLDQFRTIKTKLGGTVNDAILAAVSGALGAYMRNAGVDTTGLVLKAMVPVSVRADVERGALGNRVAAMWAPLPVGIVDARERFAQIGAAMDGLKESGQAVGAQVLTELTGFAPPTIMAQAARLQARQRFFNLVVTNVPGPQIPLYILGRRLQAMYPVVPLAANQALGIAIFSYAGKLGFGLLADYDALPGLEQIAVELERAIADLAAAAGIKAGRGSRANRRRPGAARAGRGRSSAARAATNDRGEHKRSETASTNDRGQQPHSETAATGATSEAPASRPSQ